MTSEDKQLMLKDLSARLPYGVICHTEKGDGHLCSINQIIFGTEYGLNISPIKRDYFNDSEQDEVVIKPYLRPMSSMTEEEKKELKGIGNEYLDMWVSTDDPLVRWELDAKTSSKRAEFYNSHYLDWNGLIKKGLALEAPEDLYEDLERYLNSKLEVNDL